MTSVLLKATSHIYIYNYKNGGQGKVKDKDSFFLTQGQADWVMASGCPYDRAQVGMAIKREDFNCYINFKRQFQDANKGAHPANGKHPMVISSGFVHFASSACATSLSLHHQGVGAPDQTASS